MTGRSCDLAAPEYQSMAKATLEFLDNNLEKYTKYKNFPRRMKDIVKAARKKQKSFVMSPHWFLQKDTEEYVAIIKKELKWNYPRMSYPAESTNCALNFISVEQSIRHYGYTHYHVEMSKLIRLGTMTRENALSMLEKNYDDTLLESILAKMGCAAADLK